MALLRPRRRSVLRHPRGRRLVAALAVAAAVAAGPARPAGAQEGTLHAQATLLDDAVWTATFGLRYTTPLGDASEEGGVLPGPGQTVERAGRRWLFTAMAGGGIARGRGSGAETRGTAVGYVGALYRLESVVESVGAVAWGSLEPGFLGPAVAVRALTILEVLAGVGTLEERSGASWFASVAVSVALFRDLGS